MDLFRYSPTLESLKESGDLKDNYKKVNWKLIQSEVIVSHNMNNVRTPLSEFLESVKNDILSYCGNPDDLEDMLNNVR